MMVKKILFYYCFLFALFILVSGLLSSKTTDQLLMQLIFFPVTAYFAFTLVAQMKKKDPDQPIHLRKKTTLVFIALFFLLSLLSMSQTTKTNTQKIPASITEIPSPTRTPKKITHVMVKTDEENVKVNIREEASTSAKIVRKVSNGTTFIVKGEQKDWYKIILDDGSFGYIHRDFAVEESLWEK